MCTQAFKHFQILLLCIMHLVLILNTSFFQIRNLCIHGALVFQYTSIKTMSNNFSLETMSNNFLLIFQIGTIET